MIELKLVKDATSIFMNSICGRFEFSLFKGLIPNTKPMYMHQIYKYVRHLDSMTDISNISTIRYYKKFTVNNNITFYIINDAVHYKCYEELKDFALVIKKKASNI